MIANDYEQAMTLIRRLDRSERARLVAEIVAELADEPAPPTHSIQDPRAALAEIRAHFASLGPVSPTAGEQVDLDRQSRTDPLEGTEQTI